jgi:hypothetical protein
MVAGRCALMRIHHCSPKRDFTVIPNGALRDERLTWGARGYLHELLSRPDDWETNADAAAARARRMRPDRHEGRRVVRGYVAELEAVGYMRRERLRAERGRWETVLHVADEPVFAADSAPADVPPGGTSAPPAETGVSPARTDVPPTDTPVSGTSIRRLTNEETKRENTASRDRGKPRRPAIAEEFISDVAEELAAETRADAAEYRRIGGMLENGAHPAAVRNAVSAGRFGPRAKRRSTAKRCETHGMPVAVDGSCSGGCPGVWDEAAP